MLYYHVFYPAETWLALLGFSEHELKLSDMTFSRSEEKSSTSDARSWELSKGDCSE